MSGNHITTLLISIGLCQCSLSHGNCSELRRMGKMGILIVNSAAVQQILSSGRRPGCSFVNNSPKMFSLNYKMTQKQARIFWLWNPCAMQVCDSSYWLETTKVQNLFALSSHSLLTEELSDFLLLLIACQDMGIVRLRVVSMYHPSITIFFQKPKKANNKQQCSSRITLQLK